MSAKRHLLLLCALLFLIGGTIFCYRAFVMHWPLTPDKKTKVWTLESRIQFEPEEGRPMKLSLLLPPPQENFNTLDEHFVSRNYGVTTTQKNANRESVWSIRRASGPQTLYYQMIVYSDQNFSAPAPKEPPIPTHLTLTGPDKAAAEALVKTVRAQSADSITFAAEIIKMLNHQTDENVRTLLNKNFSVQNIVTVANKVLEGPKIRTQVIHGFRLDDAASGKRDIPDMPMLAVWESEKAKWVYINPTTAQIGLPADYFIWWVGNHKVANLEGGHHLTVSLSARKTLKNALEITGEEADAAGSSLWKFSLFSLPLHTQNVYQIMIMIPLGAFIILLLRNVIGIQTFGTFMPVLVALAFRETNLLSGIILFSLVIACGLLVRFYLEHLKLLLVPRIATVLSVVVMIMMTLSILSYHLGIEYGLSIALFPMVIMTMTIERMSIVWEERNPLEAILQVTGSLFAASIAYLAMYNPIANHLFFTFPELLLVLMSIMLLMGRYRGYRLSEIIRFKSLLPHFVPNDTNTSQGP